MSKQAEDVNMEEIAETKQIKTEVAETMMPSTGLKSRLQQTKHDVSFLCVVCTDRASGHHYGVPACEGCKAFFKRSLRSTDLNYKCPANSNCTIDKMSRKCCQACRLKKCNVVGMSKEFLGNKIKRSKVDTDKLKHKYRNKRSGRSSDSDPLVESTTSAHEMELESMLHNLSSLHAGIYVKAEDFEAEPSTIGERFCNTVDQQLIHIIDWAKQLPDYCNLPISDQAILLQAAWVDLLVLNWVFHSSRVNDAIQFSKMFSIHMKDAVELGFENIYKQLLALTNRAKKYDIDEIEISCLKAICLTNADSGSLRGPDMVNDLITKFSMALQYHSNNCYRDNTQKFAKLFLILPQLKYLVNQVIEFLYTMRLEASNNLSDLVIEMLEAKQRL